MPTIRLIPSTYAVSSTQYLSVSNASNMYTNTDSTTYATITNTYASTSSRYLYLRGFNFGDIPSTAEITSFTVKIKGYESGLSTSTSYAPRLADGTSALSNTTASTNFGTSTKTITIPTGSLTWQQIANYGSNFTIMVYVRRSNRNTTGYFYCHGAEIEVTYSIPNPVNVSSILKSGEGTISPSGTIVSYEGEEYTLTITPTDKSDEVTLERNGTDITNQLEAHYAELTPISSVPGSSVTTGFSRTNGKFYQSSSTSSDAWLRYAIGHSAESPYSTSNTSNTYCKDGTNDADTMGWMNFPFDFSSLPVNAIIDEVEVKVYGAAESTSETARHSDVELYSGTTLKSTRQSFTSTENGILTVSNPGTWTRSELQNAQLRFIVGYYGGRILGATWKVTYSLPSSEVEYYTYTFTVGTTDTVLEVTIGASQPYIPEPEDPTKTYYSLTISSINATTDPDGGTTRVESGVNQVVTITPSDPQLTLALDNGTDITSQLVAHNIPSNTYTVTGTVSGASYGFELNNSTGYYTSNNNGEANSAAVSRINFDLDTDCLVTIEYINYAEATYDYGIFGRVDTALSTSYTSDSNAYHTCSANSDNTPNVQTLTYNVSSGTHFIDIKYRKDTYTDSYNDNLQWKITSIESTEGSGYYTYTLNNISQKHSLIFIFGDVSYYFITSTTAGNGRSFPDGQQVVLEGDSYRLNIVPDSTSASVTLTDNNINVTSQLEQASGTDKSGNPVVSYKYTISNIQAAHDLIISIGNVSLQLYIKQNGSWVSYSKVYKKINGEWVEQPSSSWDILFSEDMSYRRMN